MKVFPLHFLCSQPGRLLSTFVLTNFSVGSFLIVFKNPQKVKLQRVFKTLRHVIRKDLKKYEKHIKCGAIQKKRLLLEAIHRYRWMNFFDNSLKKFPLHSYNRPFLNRDGSDTRLKVYTNDYLFSKFIFFVNRKFLSLD